MHYPDIENLIRLRRYALARAALAEAIASEPNDAHLYYLAAWLAWLESDCPRGLDLSAQGLALDPDNPSLLLIRFHLLEESRQYPEAELIIIDLIRHDPADADYLAAYARLMLLTFHVKKARLLCNEALRLDPEHDAARVCDVLLMVVNGQSDASAAQLAGLLDENPESEHYLRLLALLLVEKRQYRAAQILTQQLIRRNPGDQGLIESAVSLRRITHWSSWPLWPLYRFGWPASVALWLGLVLLLQLNRSLHLPGLGLVNNLYLAWCVYSWVHGPLLEKWLHYRGIN
jgi:tetratricopeptide (TPR) repeat protein